MGVVGKFVGGVVQQWKELNTNVQLVLGFTASNAVSEALYKGNLQSNYTYMLSGGSNSFVGALSSFAGIGQLGCAIPSGYLADKYRRDTIIKAAGVMGIFGILAGLSALFFVPPFHGKCDDDIESIGDVDCIFPLFQCVESICIFLTIQFFSQGAWFGLSNPPVESIFADSVMTGERTNIYAVKFNTRLVFYSFGPLVTIALLLTFGDKWELSILRKVLVFGLLLKIIPSILCFFFDDDNSLGRESEGGLWNEERERGKERDEDEENLVEREEKEMGEEDLGEEGEEDGKREEEEEEGISLKCFHPKSKHFIPFLMTMSDLIMACGAGMTIQFFPLYFRNLNMSPISVTIVYFFVPIVTSIVSFFAVPFSKVVGRMPTVLLLAGLGILLLVAMVFVQHPVYSSILYILRSAFMRATDPQIRSVLMDAVEKSARTKWNSLESFKKFSWTGSSLVGGVLVDKHGYGFTFLITAALYSIAWCVLLPLVNLDGPPCSKRKGDFEIVEEEGEEGGDGVEMKEFRMEEEDEEGEGEGGEEGEKRGEE